MECLQRSLIVILLFFFLHDGIVHAQLTPYETQLEQELEKRGISQEELNLLLLQRGITVNDLQSLTPTQLTELQEAIENLQIAKQKVSGQYVPVDTNGVILDTLGDGYLFAIDSTRSNPTDTSKAVIFGHHIFKTGQIELIKDATSYNPPDHYRISGGDQLSVSIFSNSAQLDELLTVNGDGSVMIREGRVKVFIKGLTLNETRTKLIKNYRNYTSFTEGQFNLSLATARSISIQIYGEVQKPGTYTALAINSVLNFLSEADGFTDNASVRNIKLIKRNGSDQIFDLYTLLTNPTAQNDFFLEDGDLIFVPAMGNVVSIQGAVQRPHKYELIATDQLYELIKYAGGLQPEAYLSSIRILRFDENKRVVKDVPYASLIKSGTNFPLINGDQIIVDSIATQLENYVKVVGEVRNQGEFERREQMTIKDLIRQAELKNSSKTDFAFLKRINDDGSINLIPLSIDKILDDTAPFDNFLLKDKDELTIWAKERFTDQQYVKISGAVRYEEVIPYDDSGSLRAADAILIAGGLSRDAADYAHIHRLDPLNPGEKSYVRLDIFRLMNDPNSADNIKLEPFDSIHIYSRNDFQDEVFIKVSGAVNNPGEFIFGDGITLKDAIVLAGGFRRSSATNDIEVSRVIIKDNQPTKTTIQKISLSRDDITDFSSKEGLFSLEPFDNIFVRYVPEFELQQNVTISGEVVLPGDYSLVKENESVYDLLIRAGGLTEEAFPQAATLYRTEDSLGYIVMRMEEVIFDHQSKYNYSLKNGDVITIPKIKDYVTIVGSTQLEKSQSDQIVGKGNTIRVPYHKGKDALFYINYYAGGFADDARRDKVFVLYPNGEVKTTEKKFLIGKKHPEVLPGSIIQVGKKKVDLYGSKKEEDVNWTKVLGDSVAQAMSILTLILLVQRLD